MIELRRRYNKVADTPSYNRLPKEYQEVEYLESDGQSYLEIPFDNVRYDDRIKFGFKSTNASAKHIFGSSFVNGNATMVAMYYLSGENTSIFRWFIYQTQNNMIDIRPHNKYDVEIQYPTLKMTNNDTQSVNEYQLNQITSETLYSSYFTLFTAIFNGRPEGTFTNGKIFYFNIDGKIDLIPCYRISDRVAGMYDIVNDVFYTNAGTGEFLVGQDVHYNIPLEYQQVEYIIMPKGGYIGLGVNAKGSLKVEIKFALDQIAPAWLFGSRREESVDNFAFLNHTTNNFKRFPYGNNSNNITPAITDTNDHIIVMDKGYAYLDDIEMQIRGEQSFEGLEMVLNGYNNNGTIVLDASHKFYYCNIWDNGQPIREFIPCYRKEDNVAGMYDLVSGDFYTNAGTGEFLVGPDVIG